MRGPRGRRGAFGAPQGPAWGLGRSPMKATITSVHPLAAVAGGRVTIRGPGVGARVGPGSHVQVGDRPARILYADRDRVVCQVPSGLPGGTAPVRLAGAPGETAFLEVGLAVATGVHQVDSPVIGSDGTLYLTYSGTRGDESPVSVFRVRRDAYREPFVTGITNPTSLALHPDGRLFVSSRFDGAVYAVDDDGRPERVAADLGVACGLAFAPDGTLYVGDRSGTVFRVSPAGEVDRFATLPPSVAAFHLVRTPGGTLYVTAPTLGTRDAVYAVSPEGVVSVVCRGFGRPQGMAVDAHGALHVVEALAGASGLYRVRTDGGVEQIVAGPSLVGAAFDATGGAVVVSDDAAYRFARLGTTDRVITS